MKKALVITGALLTLSSAAMAKTVDLAENYNGVILSIPAIELENKAAEKKINKAIYEKIEDAKDFVEKNKAMKMELGSSYEVLRDDDKYLTVYLNCSFYPDRAAHPSHLSYGMVFDKETGKQLPVSYFVDLPSLYRMRQFVKYGYFELEAVDGSKLPYSDETFGLEYISDQYLLDDNDNIRLLYQRYDLGPYAAGNTYIAIDKEYVDRHGKVLPKG